MAPGELVSERVVRERRAAQVPVLVLAAGASTRMGQNKLLFSLWGTSLVRRSVESAIRAGVGPVHVVLGHESEKVEAELRGLACQRSVNPRHAEGQRTSLQFGLRGLSDEAPAAVVMLADMPFVSAEMIAALVEAYRASAVPLVMSRYGQVEAPPMLYDRALFPELLAIAAPHCAKSVARLHRAQAEVLSWPEAALRDVDEPEDYRALLAEPTPGESAR